MRVAAYRWMRRLPKPLRAIAQSFLTKPIRDWWFRPGGTAKLFKSDLRFEGLAFEFWAPVQLTERLQRQGGIENGICRLILQEKPAVFFDVGANYGFLSCVARAGGAQVFAFEADASIHQGLLRNVPDAVHAFVGTDFTLDGFAKERGVDPDFIKIDVDGPELEVLQGAMEILARRRPTLVVELTHKQAEILSLLQGLGYCCTGMDGEPVRSGKWPPNIFAHPTKALSVPPSKMRAH